MRVLSEVTNVAVVRVAVNGVRLWVDVMSPEVVIGDGLIDRPTVIGVHGGPGIDSTSLIGVLAPLADVAQIVRFDQRGHGRSEHGSPEEWRLDTWADDLGGLIAALGVDRPILIGTSFGAHIALACAARHQDRVGGVIAAYGGGRLDEAITVEAFRRLGGDRAASAATGDPSDPEGSFATWLEVCWPLVSRSKHGVKHLERMQQLSRHSPDVHAAFEGNHDPDQLPPGVGAIGCPVLVIGGLEDPLSTADSMRELADALVGAHVELVLVEDAGHTLFLDQPDVAYAAVKAFVSSVHARLKT